jgi:hypothetical protein
VVLAILYNMNPSQGMGPKVISGFFHSNLVIIAVAMIAQERRKISNGAVKN